MAEARRNPDVTAAQAARAMSQAPARSAVEARILAYLRHDYAETSGRAAFFAEDGRFEDPIGAPLIDGKPAIEAAMQRTVAAGWRSLLEPQKMFICGREAAVVVTAQVSRHGAPVMVTPVVLTFVLDDHMLFRHVRCFLDYDGG